MSVDPFALRDDLADDIDGAVPCPVYREPPDALVPPAVVVSWEASRPGDQSGIVTHSLAVEVWPSPDLNAQAHWLNRDDLIRDALTALRAWSPKSAAAIGWTAGNETRQLGQQTTRVSVLRVEVAEPDLCP